MLRSLLLTGCLLAAGGTALAAPPAKTPSAPAPAVAATPTPVASACTRPEPPAPDSKPVRPAVPEKPACLDAKGGCPGWEAYSFNDAVKAYNLQIQAFRPLAEAYVQKLNAYVKAAGDYAQCEVKTLQ